MRFLPKTLLGKWSAGLIVLFFLSFAVLYAFIDAGEKGGATFFSNLKLTIPALISTFSAIAAFFTGTAGIVKSREWSLTVFLAVLVGFLVLWWVLGEILFPH